MRVSELFVSIEVADMQRAIGFYTRIFGAEIAYASERWSSLMIAGMRLGLFHLPSHAGGRTGLHLVVDDLAEAVAEVEGAGGRIAQPPTEVAPGVVTAEVIDTEGNQLTLRA